MKLLLDTCAFLWFINGDNNLPSSLRSLITEPGHEVYLSAISIWEVVLKTMVGRLILPEPAGPYLIRQRQRHGIEDLPLDEASVVHLARLPQKHRDPFDRMLICQAMEHSLILATPDSAITSYPIKTLWQEG